MIELQTIIYALLSCIILIILSYIILKKYFKKEGNNIPRKSQYLERYAKAIQKYEKENKKRKYVDIIFIGDSLIYHYDIHQFYKEYKVLNRGISGEKTFGLEKRLNISCFEVKSKMVIMLIGINNIKTMFENYESILIAFKKNINERKIILCSLTCMGGKRGRKYNKLAIENNKVIKNLAIKYNFIFIDLFTPLLNEKTNQIYDEYTRDGLHLTYEGYKIITREIKKVINDI